MSVWASLLLLGELTPVATSPAAIDPVTWVTPEDYPAEALASGWEGVTTFRLSIDPAGAVQDCVIVTSSSHEVLDRETCEIMLKRGHFTPARDAGGNTVAGQIQQKFRWQIPGSSAGHWAVVRFSEGGLECLVDQVKRLSAEKCGELAGNIQKIGGTLPARVQVDDVIANAN